MVAKMLTTMTIIFRHCVSALEGNGGDQFFWGGRGDETTQGGQEGRETIALGHLQLGCWLMAEGLWNSFRMGGRALLKDTGGGGVNWPSRDFG